MIVHVTITQVTAMSERYSDDHVLCEELQFPDGVDAELPSLEYAHRIMEDDGTIRKVVLYTDPWIDETTGEGFHFSLTTPREACKMAAMLDYQQHTHGHICDDDGTCADTVLVDDEWVYDGD